MKYIRTKDGIFENNTRFNDETLRKVSNGLIEIIKQADTIEELCDEFIIKHKYDTVLPYEIVNSLKPILNGMKVYIDEFKKSDVYGAIWTDKGLVYVAKMNDKGELELL